MQHTPQLKMFEALPKLVNSNAHLVHRGRFLSALLKVGIGPSFYLLEISRGQVQRLSRQFPLFQTFDLSLSASEQAWLAHWQKLPEPGWHDLFAMHKQAQMQIEGNSQLLFAHLQYLKDLLSAPRQLCHS